MGKRSTIIGLVLIALLIVAGVWYLNSNTPRPTRLTANQDATNLTNVESGGTYKHANLGIVIAYDADKLEILDHLDSIEVFKGNSVYNSPDTDPNFSAFVYRSVGAREYIDSLATSDHMDADATLTPVISTKVGDIPAFTRDILYVSGGLGHGMRSRIIAFDNNQGNTVLIDMRTENNFPAQLSEIINSIKLLD